MPEDVSCSLVECLYTTAVILHTLVLYLDLATVRADLRDNVIYMSAPVHATLAQPAAGADALKEKTKKGTKKGKLHQRDSNLGPLHQRWKFFGANQ